MELLTRGLNMNRNRFDEGASKFRGPLALAIRNVIRNPIAIVGGFIVLILLLCTLLAPYISPYDPTKVNLNRKLSPPSTEFILGTDEFGRDLFTRIIWGGRVSLSVAFITVGLSMIIGVVMGLLSGYFGGWVDQVIMRFVDILLCFPILLMALGLVAILGPKLINIMMAVGIALTPQYARIIRGAVLPLRKQYYVEASRGLGATHLYILIQHILPNAFPSIIVVATLNVATAILIESSLSFLGLGVQPPTPSWGAMIAGGRQWLLEAPWISSFSGAAIMIAVLGFNFFGDALRDIMDPRLHGGAGRT
jgi:peptide/nickel transport system permease protein